MDFTEKQIGFFDKLKEYYLKIEKIITPRSKSCGSCIECCYHLINYLHSPLEIDYANYYLIKSGNPDNLPVLSWQDHIEQSAGLCIYCDMDKKICRLYKARFNLCRIYGPFITDTDLTCFPSCVYKWSAVQHGTSSSKLIPYNEEYESLVMDYLELVSEDVKRIYLDITDNAFGTVARKRLLFAVEHYKKLIAASPDNGYLYGCLGRAYRNLGNSEEAIKYFHKSIEIDSNQEMAYLDIGTYYYKQKLTDKAEEYFRKALKIEPSDSQARYSLIMCLLKQKRFEEASSEFCRLTDESFQYEERLLRERDLIDLI
ncbi:MAG TPA: tetratricopeptide repeat protein [Candidatus Eremiobacteraeota bacterium]|nr:MAG: Tetratricopeptide repeat protein [bacterium ADurb.Bin363]HPZ08436.1 tetratricopeptide repeat protein [Candidatus Eremiobacteraeota bacterium]